MVSWFTVFSLEKTQHTRLFVCAFALKPLISLLTIVHVAVSFCGVQLNSSQIVLLCFSLLPLKEKGGKSFIEPVNKLNYDCESVFCFLLYGGVFFLKHKTKFGLEVVLILI